MTATPSAPGAVEAARYGYWLASYRLALLERDGWGDTPHFHQVALWVESKSIALDNAVAETLAGRRPRIASREFPLA